MNQRSINCTAPAGLPQAERASASHRRSYPEPRDATSDEEDDAYLLAKSYFDMKVPWGPSVHARHLLPLPDEQACAGAATSFAVLCGRRMAQSPALLERITWPNTSSSVPQEYRRVAHALRGMSGARAVFLRGYSRYLAGERRREEERVEAAGPLGKADAINAVGAMNPLYWIVTRVTSDRFGP